MTLVQGVFKTKEIRDPTSGSGTVTVFCSMFKKKPPQGYSKGKIEKNNHET